MPSPSAPCLLQPVNFTLDGADAIIQTSSGEKLAAAVSGSVVAFEADDIDTATRSGWSVVVLGHARLVHDIDQLAVIVGPDSRPWVAGRSDHVIRIEGDRITGRRSFPRAMDDLHSCPSRAPYHGDSRGTTDNNGQISLTVHEKTSLLTLGHGPDLCTEVLRCGLTAEQYSFSVSR